MPEKLSGRAAVEAALTAVGERLAYANAPCTIVVLGGAAINLLGIVERPTVDVDVLARADETGAIHPPDPLPDALQAAIAAVARDRALLENWMNTTAADQWRFGLPPGLAERIEWRSYGALRVGIVGRRDLVCFKLYAAADQTGPDSVHVRDLLALKPGHQELEWAVAWVRTQDPSPQFQEVIGRVVEICPTRASLVSRGPCTRRSSAPRGLSGRPSVRKPRHLGLPVPSWTRRRSF